MAMVEGQAAEMRGLDQVVLLLFLSMVRALAKNEWTRQKTRVPETKSRIAGNSVIWSAIH